MKKLIVFAMVLMLCATMVLPVCAQEFVPSITYKDGVDVAEATMDGQSVSGCVEVTSIKEANDKTTDITQAARDLLLEVYNKLTDGSMKLPLEGDYVIVELVDISFAHNACEENAEHDHVNCLNQDNTTITVKLDNMNGNHELRAFTYNDGQWTEIKNVVNNGDGTVTCEFEHFCPVAFCVEGDALEQGPATGDSSNLILWVGIMLAAAAGLVTVLTFNRRRAA